MLNGLESMKANRIIALIFLLCGTSSFAQQTVGLFEYNNTMSEGYTLFAPSRSDSVFLIDNCGNQQYLWATDYTPGGAVYLLEDGTLIHNCKFDNGSPISAGGAGGRIEAINPNQTIAWEFNYSNDTVRHHHGSEVLPNGNVLLIAWELVENNDAILAGRDPSTLGLDGLWPEHIIEYDPVADAIVWEWHTWDHMIQDHDPSMANYGVVEDHPELFDLNYNRNSNINADWQHWNSLDYNADLDQIIVSSPFWNEVYIIDHSTTTAEAASHSGGDSGKGGDILWRWGNPRAYGAGDTTDQQLFFQHDAHWIDAGLPNEGKIMLFNNGQGRTPVEYSTVEILEPSILPDGSYEMAVDGTFLPAGMTYTYTAPNPTDFYSKIVSGAQQLPNGNILIDEGNQGRFFEIDANDNIVWEYVNPVTDSILEQGEVIPGTSNLNNMVFRIYRYAPDYAGLSNLSLTNQGPIELNPSPSNCTVSVDELDEDRLVLYPNPADEIIIILNAQEQSEYEIVDAGGRVVMSGDLLTNQVYVGELNAGVYFLQVKSPQDGISARFTLLKK